MKKKVKKESKNDQGKGMESTVSAHPEMESDVDSIDFSIFRVGNELFAVPLDQVSEILHEIKIEEISHLSEYFRGVIRFRDTTLPVVDMDKLLIHTHPDSGSDACLLIKGKDGLYGMLVDSDVDIIKVPTVQIHPLPDCYSQEEAAILNGILVHQDNLYGILNPEGIYLRCRTKEVLREKI